MIYKITVIGVPKVIELGGTVIKISSDNMSALVQNISDTTELNILETFQDADLETALEGF